MADDLTVGIGATIQGLITALNEASDLVKKHTGLISSSISNITGAVSGLMAPLAALGGLVAGGKLFGDAVRKAADWNVESLRLARTLGTTTQEASILKVALQNLGLDTETYTRASNFLSRQVAQGGDAFRRLGISIRDSSGHLRPMNEIMMDSLGKLQGLQAGIDRNAAGIQLFGRGWMESGKLILLTGERMAQAKQEAEALHLVVGPEGAAKAFQYQEGLRKLGLISDSLRIQVGTALMPVLERLGAWLGESGPRKAELLANTIRALISGFLILKAVVETITTGLVAQFDIALTSFQTLLAAFNALATGGPAAAWRVLQQGAQKVEASWKAAAANIKESWADASRGMREVWEPPKTTTQKREGEGARFTPEEGGAVVKRWREELEQIKALQENWFTWTATRELEFWSSKKALVRSGTEAYRAALAEENRLRKETLKEQRELEKEALKHREQVALEGLETEERAIRGAAQQNLMTGEEERAQLEALERRKYEVRKQYFDAQLQLEGLTALQKAQLREQEYQAEVELNRKLQELALAASAERVAAIRAFVEPMVGEFSKALRDMLTGVKSFADSARALFKALGETVLQTLLQMGAKWLVTKLMELIAGRVTAVSEVSQNAAVAGSAAAASQAGIPVVGPALAAAAMAQTSALVLGTMMPLAVAARGYRVPAMGGPQYALLHPRETVLPAELSEGLQALVVGGGGGGITINALDSQSVDQALRNQRSSLARASRDLLRDRRRG